MEAEGHAEGYGIRAGLRLLSRVEPRQFKICQPQLEPSWSWRKAKNEKWMFHLRKDGKLRQWKLGESEESTTSDNE